MMDCVASHQEGPKRGTRLTVTGRQAEVCSSLLHKLRVQADYLDVLLSEQFGHTIRAACGPKPMLRALMRPDQPGCGVTDRVSGDEVKLRSLKAELAIQLGPSLPVLMGFVPALISS